MPAVGWPIFEGGSVGSNPCSSCRSRIGRCCAAGARSPRSAAHRAGRRRDRRGRAAQPTRPTGSPPTASCRCWSVLPEHDRPGLPRPALLPCQHHVRVVPRGAGTSLSGGALPLADGIVLGMAQVQPHPRHRLRQPRGRGAAGRHQPRHHPGGGARGLLLRARPVQPDRLHHRRQRRREFGRRALPEIRPDHQQRARRRDGADRPARWSASAASISIPKATTCSASWSAPRGCSASSPR